MAEIHEGGCHCGAVSYRVTGGPLGAYVCHCTYCQRSSGTAFQMPVFFQSTDVEFSGEAPRTYDYESPSHGRILRSQFCLHCGTKIGTKAMRAPEFQLISGGTFNDQWWYEISAHMFTEEAPSWMAFPANVRCYTKHFITETDEPERPLPRQFEPWCRCPQDAT